jgi:hypothetical protein
LFCIKKGICTANTQQAQSPQQQQAQHHIYCQPFFGLKWVVIFAGIYFFSIKFQEKNT